MAAILSSVKVEHLYVYATGDRTDGLRYAVGVLYSNGKSNGAYALFAEYAPMCRFVETESAQHKVKVHFLGSITPMYEREKAENDN